MRIRNTLCLLALCAATPTMAQADRQNDQFDLAITNVTIVDVENGTLIEGQTVVVEEATIVGIMAADDSEPTANRVIDGTGQFLIPGLIDMHVHADRSAFPLFLEHGVTTVRDMGTHFAPLRPDSGGQLVMRAENAADPTAGPELFLALRILDGETPRNPRWAMHFAAVATPEEGRQYVRDVANAGGDFVKVYTDLAPDVFSAVADEAGQLGLRFSGHVPGQVGHFAAARAGIHTSEHLRGIFIDISIEEDFWRAAFAEAAATGDPSATYLFTNARLLQMAATRDPAREAELAALLREEEVGIVPTLVVLDDPRWRYPSATPDAALLDRLSPIYRSIASVGEDVTGPFGSVAEGIAAFEEQSSLVGRLHATGVTILVGTDASNPFVIPGISVHEELGNLVRAGLSPSEALRAATLLNARYLDAEERLGSVEMGKEADLLLLDANPLEDIAATRSITTVIVNGQVYSPEEEEEEEDEEEAANPAAN